MDLSDLSEFATIRAQTCVLTGDVLVMEKHRLLFSPHHVS